MNSLLQTLGDLSPIWFAQTDPAAIANPVAGAWDIRMIVPIVLGAIGYSLLQCGVVQSRQWGIVGVVFLLAAIVGSLWFVPPGLDHYIAYLFCAIAIGGAIGFLTAREPVYAALGFATAVLSVSGIMFMQSALFIAAANMIVYAGAIIIIFLFVLMFAQKATLQTYDIKLTSPYLASVIGCVVLGSLVYCLTADGAIPKPKPDATRLLSESAPPAQLLTDEGNETIERLKKQDRLSTKSVLTPSVTSGLGRSLYTDYLLAVALAGTVLTVAAVGAIALATKSTGEESGRE